MPFENDQGSCTGRGFTDVDADGYLKNLHDFITGHADWSIILDRSTYPTQKTCTAAATATDVITAAAHDHRTGEIVNFVDTGNGLPTGLAGKFVILSMFVTGEMDLSPLLVVLRLMESLRMLDKLYCLIRQASAFF